jgi:hypothetical protein
LNRFLDMYIEAAGLDKSKGNKLKAVAETI